MFESINNVKSLCITQKCLIAFGLKTIYCKIAISTNDDHLSFEILTKMWIQKLNIKPKFDIIENNIFNDIYIFIFFL